MATAASSRVSTRKKIETGTLYVQSTYNNTLLTLGDSKGNIVAQASSGALGFKGAKKGTPYAAAKVGEALAERAKGLGLRDVFVVISGVGAGRESSIRSFIAGGFQLMGLRDVTPVPHNGPRPKKARRV